MNPERARQARAAVLGVALLGLVGCQDRIEMFVRVRHGVATIEARAENLWSDGLSCSGAESCAQVLDAERQKQVEDLTGEGATVTASGFVLRGDEIDLVLRYTIPVERMADDQILPITVQRPSDVRAGRAGVPSIAIMHLAGSPTTVELTGPAVRMTGDLAKVPGVSAVENLVGKSSPDVVIDVLTRGRGRAHVVIPSVDDDGRVEHGAAWIQEQAGLKELLATKGMLLI